MAPAEGPRAAVLRGMAALWPGVARGAEGEADVFGLQLHALTSRDVFRRAHIHFNVYGRPLHIECDDPPSIMHWTYPFPIVLNGARNIYTVHDLIPLTHAQMTSIDGDRHRRVLNAILPYASGVAAVSQAAAEIIRGGLGLAPEFVTNLGQAVDIDDEPSAPLPHGLVAGGYFLYCGAVEPRKNLIATVEAFGASGATRPLVVAGPDGWCAKEINAVIERHANVVRMPWVERPILASMMRQARAVLFCTLEEGFGLPVAEALALGVPVIASDLPSIREVGAGAPLYIDPNARSEIAAAILAVDTNDELRLRLASLGAAQAARFSRETYAQRLIEYYRRLIEAKAYA
jgi:glycosyltransferase involved in cell wall biosynthesis